MRVILFLLIVGIVAVIAAISTGYVNVSQTRPAKAPQVSTANGVRATGGQTPSFDVQTGSVKVEVEEKNVKVPTLKVEPAQAGSTTEANQNAN
jgi:hypothetical protein